MGDEGPPPDVQDLTSNANYAGGVVHLDSDDEGDGETGVVDLEVGAGAAAGAADNDAGDKENREQPPPALVQPGTSRAQRYLDGSKCRNYSQKGKDQVIGPGGSSLSSTAGSTSSGVAFGRMHQRLSVNAENRMMEAASHSRCPAVLLMQKPDGSWRGAAVAPKPDGEVGEEGGSVMRHVAAGDVIEKYIGHRRKRARTKTPINNVAERACDLAQAAARTGGRVGIGYGRAVGRRMARAGMTATP
eukprot:g256.t1